MVLQPRKGHRCGSRRKACPANYSTGQRWASCPGRDGRVHGFVTPHCQRVLAMSPQPSVAEARSQVEALLGEVGRATPTEGELAAIAAVHRKGAVNLRHYLALRAHDVRRLQNSLAELGLSSLGRAEGHVQATLLAVHRALTRLQGESDGTNALVGPNFQEARPALGSNADALLGPAPEGRAVRVMVTADAGLAQNADSVRALVERGMSCLRINCAHDSAEVWTRIAGHLRRAEQQLGVSCRLLMDLGGPRFGPAHSSPGPPS